MYYVHSVGWWIIVSRLQWREEVYCVERQEGKQPSTSVYRLEVLSSYVAISGQDVFYMQKEHDGHFSSSAKTWL